MKKVIEMGKARRFRPLKIIIEENLPEIQETPGSNLSTVYCLKPCEIFRRITLFIGGALLKNRFCLENFVAL